MSRNIKPPGRAASVVFSCKKSKGGGSMAEKISRREQTILNYKANGGNMKRAMIDAGYSETYADRNSKYLLGIIGEQIKEEQKAIKSKKIKSVTQIQEWWAEMMDDAEVEHKDRIKCSELLAKSQGAFIDKVEVNGQINNPLAGLSSEDLKKLIGDD
jgi:phage terminase small subunit